jgi:hypothetical protein
VALYPHLSAPTTRLAAVAGAPHCFHLQVYAEGAAPVEDFYRSAGRLLEFEITGGIPETLPRLMAALEPYIRAAGVDSDAAESKKARAAAVA